MATLIDNAILHVLPTSYDLYQLAAEDLNHRATIAIQAKGAFTLVLSGGNTPKSFFDTLCRQKHLPWDKIQFFFGDERYLPFDNPESNYHMAYEHLFSQLPIPSENIHRMPTELSDPKDAAEDYTHTLQKFFHLRNQNYPQFDLIYLGLGDNAHTASLMPFSEPVISPEKPGQLVVSLWVPELQMHRLTLTPTAINNATCITFLVTGANKASAVSKVLEGSYEPQRYPAQLIHGLHGKTIWYLDQAAAEQLSSSHLYSK